VKRKSHWIVFWLASAACVVSLGAGAQPLPELKAAPQEARAARIAAELLTRFHYTPVPLDDALSAKIFDRFLKSLDGEKLVFVQADVDAMAPYRTRLDDAILTEDLSIPFAMFNLYVRRVAERFAYARGLLAKGFDFRADETFQVQRDKAAWPKTEDEARDLWRKRVKNDWLRLKLAGKDDRSIVEVLDKRYDAFVKRTSRIRGADAFQQFMNAYTTAIEPHTNYLGPQAATEFGISMRLSLVGIGASLAEIDDFITIRELLPGGPAIASGLLKAGDRIVGVAQGADGAMTDVLGWRVDDAVGLIRGAPDSVVRLDVLPADSGPDGKHRVVSLVRKTISLEAQAARSAVRTVGEGKGVRRIGVITLPTFYEDFSGRQKGAPDYRSASRDVARLLEGLRKDRIEGLLIDLRNNGGGSLNEAIALTGMFIDKGPVVQQRGAKGEVSLGADDQPGVAWNGPLAVLVNRASASASEIFAAAIQDYGRGVVLGEPSFGKGTVQSLLDMDRIAGGTKPLFGELKMTVAQFFRINGGTTQLRGVTPDIRFPGIFDEESTGESSFDNALPWVQIRPAQFAPAGDLKGVVPVLQALHDARAKADKDFRGLQEEVAEARAERKKNMVSLNESVRRTEQALRDARLASREANRDDGLQANERNIAAQVAAEKAAKAAKDVLLDEAVRVVGDEVAVLKTDATLATRARPGSVVAPD
jgi:carboxyl-terminal processing protease